MEIVSTSQFRANQGKFLAAAKRGQSVILTSRIGSFKIIPVDDDDSLTRRICAGLEEVKRIENGEIPAKAARTFLNEL